MSRLHSTRQGTPDMTRCVRHDKGGRSFTILLQIFVQLLVCAGQEVVAEQEDGLLVSDVFNDVLEHGEGLTFVLFGKCKEQKIVFPDSELKR